MKKKGIGEIVMTATRQDAWSQDEDLLLAEVVLRHIREGSTQLTAFEEVGKKLTRTSAACGFRWNSFVRKQHSSAIEIAKKQRKDNQKESKEPVEIKVETTKAPKKTVENKKKSDRKPELSLDAVIEYMKNQQSIIDKMETEWADIKELKKEKKELEKQLKKSNEKCNLIEEDYKAMIQIMERARKMVVLQDQETSQFSFQMDKNGNLERVDK